MTKTGTSQGCRHPERRPNPAWQIKAGFLEEAMHELSLKERGSQLREIGEGNPGQGELGMLTLRGRRVNA